MDKLSVHQKSPKPPRPKRKPIKVVYISSPMKVQATASEFKGVVQELTGRDSDIADLDRIPEPSATGRFTGDNSVGATGHDVGRQLWRHPQQHCPFDGVFSPPVIDDLAVFAPSSLHYGLPPSVDDVRGRGAM